jgi:16S rRNA (adenine1518-N6/adenine1519-N6)-dimethyltransferase
MVTIPLQDRRGSRTRRAPARAKKSLGQNFLVDRRVLWHIIEAAELSGDDVVVEVGPGRGFLTSALAERAGRVVAVEVDRDLAERLREWSGDHPNVAVVTADAREVDIDSLVVEDAPYKVVANLPYYAASPIIRRFLEARHKPRLMVVMVQREVAQEMTAPPGKMGLLSVAIQLYGKPRIVASVPPWAFRPAPKVTSAVVRIDLYDRPAVPFDSSERFFHLVKAGFSARRKQLHNSLGRGLDISSEAAGVMLARAGIDPMRRAQTLSLPEWGELYQAFQGRDWAATALDEREV